MTIDDAKGLSGAKRRVLDLMKRVAPATASELAEPLGLTTTAVRQHLAGLALHGLVERVVDPPSGRGRPSDRWSLTELARDVFPDRHADLTVELIEAIRSASGDAGLDRVLRIRQRDQLRLYRSLIPTSGTTSERVDALAVQRSREGYMAESIEGDDGSVLLVEHHCPVCEAASACSGLCRGELELFRKALGADVAVTREQHLLSGDQRCVYRIRRKESGGGRRPLPDPTINQATR